MEFNLFSKKKDIAGGEAEQQKARIDKMDDYAIRDAMEADIYRVRGAGSHSLTDEQTARLKKYDGVELFRSAKDWEKRVRQKASKLTSEGWITGTDVKKNPYLRKRLEDKFKSISGRSASKRMKKIEGMNDLALDMKAKNETIAKLDEDLDNERILELKLQILEDKKNYQHKFVKAYGSKDNTESEKLAQVELEYLIQKDQLLRSFKRNFKDKAGFDPDKYNNLLKENRTAILKAKTEYRERVKASRLSAKDADSASDKTSEKKKTDSTKTQKTAADKTSSKKKTETNTGAGKTPVDKAKTGKSKEKKTTVRKTAATEALEKELGGDSFRDAMLEFADIKTTAYTKHAVWQKRRDKATGRITRVRKNYTDEELLKKVTDSENLVPESIRSELKKLLACDGTDPGKTAECMHNFINSTYAYFRSDNTGMVSIYQAERLEFIMLKWLNRHEDVKKLFVEKKRDADETLREESQKLLNLTDENKNKVKAYKAANAAVQNRNVPNIPDVNVDQNSYQDAFRNTCWAYSLSNVLKSKGRNIEPDQIVELVKKSNDPVVQYRAENGYPLQIGELNEALPDLMKDSELNIYESHLGIEDLSMKEINKLESKVVGEIAFALSKGSAVALRLPGENHYITVVGMEPWPDGQCILHYKDSYPYDEYGPDDYNMVRKKSLSTIINNYMGELEKAQELEAYKDYLIELRDKCEKNGDAYRAYNRNIGKITAQQAEAGFNCYWVGDKNVEIPDNGSRVAIAEGKPAVQKA